MLERRIATCDRQNFRKRLNEFLNAANDFLQDDLNEHNIYQILYKTELFRNSIYKCIKLKIYELLPPVRTPYNNKKLERTCQLIGEKYKGLFQNKEVIIRVQVSVPRDNWDIDNRDLRYIFNGFVYGGLISDDNIKFVSYMLEGINGKENYIKIFVSEKRNILKVSAIKPEEYFEKSVII